MVDVRVGSHEISLLLLSLGPVLEWPCTQVDSSNSLGNDVGTESCTFWLASQVGRTKTDESDIPLSSEFVHHLGTSDTIWETGEILDLDVSCVCN